MSASTPRSSWARAASRRSRPKATASSSGAGPSSRHVPISNSTAFQVRGASSRLTCASACSSARRPSAGAALGHARLADQPPGLREAALVALALERLDRRLCLRGDLLRVGLRLDQEPDPGAADARVCLHAAVPARAGGFDRALVHLLGPRMLRVALERLGDQREHRDALGARRPAAGRRRAPAARPPRCPRARARSVRPPPPAAARRAVRARIRGARSAQVGVVAVRVLEMVADDRLQLDHPLGVAALEPVRDPLVQVGAVLFRERLVGGVSHQHVGERVTLLGLERRLLRHDQPLARPAR